MTDRNKALQDLLAKVESGDSKNDGSMYRAFGDNWTHCFDAYNGSLDAAKALHEAVLPGWAIYELSMWPGDDCRVRLWGTHAGADGEMWHNYLDGRVEAVSPIPARAWLIAILKALIAQEGET